MPNSYTSNDFFAVLQFCYYVVQSIYLSCRIDIGNLYLYLQISHLINLLNDDRDHFYRVSQERKPHSYDTNNSKSATKTVFY